VRSTAGLRCFAAVERARAGFLTARVLAAGFLADFLFAGFLADFFLAGFFDLGLALRRVTRAFLAFALDTLRFRPFGVRLGLVVLARFARLAFARFFFIAPVLPPLACASTPTRRALSSLCRGGQGSARELSPAPDIQGITGDNTLLCRRWMV
jgi:hypothetical protein